MYNKAMTIGFDASRAFVGERTGTENYSYQLLKALLKIDQKNNYILYLRPTKHNTIVTNNVARRKNVEVKIIPWPRLWTQGGLAWQTFKDKLDVLFVPAHTLPVIRKPGLKTVVTVHDLGSEYLSSMHQLKQQLYLGFMQKFQLKTATKIISVSKTTKDDLVKKIGIRPEKVKVVYEGFDKKLFKPVKGLSRAELRDDILVNSLRQYDLQTGKYFLFVGTVQPRKNLERLIIAFHIVIARSRRSRGRSNPGMEFNPTKIASGPIDPRNDGVKLVIAGSKGWLSDEIYQLPKKLGIEERVKFLGYVPDENLPALYSGALALTFPSLFEGFGLPILEAQACGCPVLTSNASSMPEVGGKGAVYVDPYSIDDIVKGMEKVASDKWQVASGKAGLENIKRFSWEKCARETLEILESI